MRTLTNSQNTLIRKPRIYRWLLTIAYNCDLRITLKRNILHYWNLSKTDKTCPKPNLLQKLHALLIPSKALEKLSKKIQNLYIAAPSQKLKSEKVTFDDLKRSNDLQKFMDSTSYSLSNLLINFNNGKKS